MRERPVGQRAAAQIEVRSSKGFDRLLNSLGPDVRSTYDEKVALFVNDPRHKSLRAGKLCSTHWYFRVNSCYRVVHLMAGNVAEFIFVGDHDAFDAWKREHC